MIPLKEIRRANDQGMVNELLREGWVFLAVSSNAKVFWYHLGLPAEDRDNWTVPAAEFLAGLDSTEIDRAAMEGLPFDEPYGARRVIDYLLKILGQ